MSSELRTYILNNGTLRHANQATAQAVLELAAEGYLTIAPDDDAYRSVLLVRAQRPAQNLAPEQKLLLQALFGAVDHYGVGRRLHSAHQLPIAQTLMAVTRQLMVRDGLIRKSRPRAVYRWLFWGFVGIAALGTTAVTATLQTGAAFGLSLLAVFTAWMVIFGFLGLGQLKFRRVFRTDRGRAKLQQGANPVIPNELLLPEPRLPASSTPQPAWWGGHNWPAEAGHLAAVLEVVASALDQALPPGTKEYAPSEDLAFDDAIDQQLELQGLLHDISELELDVTDWGGGFGDGDGGGGDGGGDSGGDG
jgi:hypothetical protein